MKRRVNISLGSKTCRDIEDYLYILKKIRNTNVSREEFITSALQERLAKDSLKPISELERSSIISFSINSDLLEEIDSLVSALRKHGQRCSRAEWIAQAILDKVEQDCEKCKDSLNQSILDAGMNI